jgi:uncharacterized protein YdeI (YjbR/CyaY-like superfamily)
MASVNSSAAEPLFFATPADFRAWLEVNCEGSREQWIGFHKKDSGRPSITWPEAVDEALCVGWIDGLRKTIDAHSYKIRFTPRQAKSNWSAVNIRRVQELARQKRMRPLGVSAFASRAEEKSGIYAYENRHAAVLDKWDEQQFRSSPEAWKFFQAQPQSYRKTMIWWIVSAKRAETRRKRLATLIGESKANRRI